MLWMLLAAVQHDVMTQQAYAGLDSAIARATVRARREAVTGRTDADGTLSLRLPRGARWIGARVRTPTTRSRSTAGTPTVAAGLGFRLPLGPANAATVWRH